ncbi:AAA family ATPase, partial [Haloglomus irregulare]
MSDYVDIGDQAAADLIDEGADAGIYTLERGAGGTTTITGVTPHGPEPDVIVAAFGATADTPDFTIISVVTESIDEALREAGYETFADLANAGVDDLTGLTGTLTKSRAAAILQEAPQHVPVGTRLASAAAQRYARRLDAETDCGVARVVDLATTDIDVGEPVYRTAGLDPDSLEAQYVSAVGRNADDPVATGLHVLDDPDHPDVPKAATHPDAGDDALPADDTGQVVPPVVPVEPRLQLPLDELLAKKLARG